MSRKLYLFKDVDNSSAEDLIKSIYKINEEDEEKNNRKPIELYINTFGGVAYDCFGLVDAIITSETPVHTIVNGYAMSAGFLIAAVGHKRFCHEHSTYMYHQANGGVRGTIEDIKETHDEFNRIMEIYDSILLSKTKLEKSKLDEVKKNRSNWYFDWYVAKQVGLVDEVLK